MRLATLFAFSAAAVSALTSGGKEATKRLQVWDSGRRAEALLSATGVYDRSMAAPFVNNFILGRTGGHEICRAADTAGLASETLRWPSNKILSEANELARVVGAKTARLYY